MLTQLGIPPAPLCRLAAGQPCVCLALSLSSRYLPPAHVGTCWLPDAFAHY